MYLVLSAFTFSPVSLVATTKASAFSFTVCTLPQLLGITYLILYIFQAVVIYPLGFFFPTVAKTKLDAVVGNNTGVLGITFSRHITRKLFAR